MDSYGSTPYIKRGFQVDPKRLFYSNESIALKKLVTLVPGYGILEAGTIVAKITESTTRLGQYVPYAIAAPALNMPFFGGAYLLQDEAAGATTLRVTVKDSYKFAVGDHIAVDDNNSSPVDLGAITAIDRTTSAIYATITFTTASDLSGLDMANASVVYIQSQLTTPFSCAVGVLGEGVDTGEGEEAVGGQGMCVFSNVMLYKGLLPNYDADALTDLSGISDGQVIILK